MISIVSNSLCFGHFKGDPMNGKKNQKSHRNKIVLISLFNVIMASACLVTGTLAWFSANTAVEATGMFFKVKTLDNIDYDLYYLKNFVVNETSYDGNLNSTTEYFSGYETNRAGSVFELVNEEAVYEVGKDPRNISGLWPNHRLTFVLDIKSGNPKSFALSSWGETTLASVKTKVNEVDVNISLSWAIDMYAFFTSVTSTENVLSDLTNGFDTYRVQTLEDKFGYDQDNPANPPTSSVLCDSITLDNTNRNLLFFTIAFSDDPSTWYLKKDNGYYEKSTSGNSNCYELLSLTDLEFTLM